MLLLVGVKVEETLVLVVGVQQVFDDWSKGPATQSVFVFFMTLEKDALLCIKVKQCSNQRRFKMD